MEERHTFLNSLENWSELDIESFFSAASAFSSFEANRLVDHFFKNDIINSINNLSDNNQTLTRHQFKVRRKLSKKFSEPYNNNNNLTEKIIYKRLPLWNNNLTFAKKCMSHLNKPKVSSFINYVDEITEKNITNLQNEDKLNVNCTNNFTNHKKENLNYHNNYNEIENGSKDLIFKCINKLNDNFSPNFNHNFTYQQVLIEVETPYECLEGKPIHSRSQVPDVNFHRESTVESLIIPTKTHLNETQTSKQSANIISNNNYFGSSTLKRRPPVNKKLKCSVFRNKNFRSVSGTTPTTPKENFQQKPQFRSSLPNLLDEVDTGSTASFTKFNDDQVLDHGTFIYHPTIYTFKSDVPLDSIYKEFLKYVETMTETDSENERTTTTNCHNNKKEVSRCIKRWRNKWSELLWLELKAWHNGNTMKVEDLRLCQERTRLAAVLDEIYELSFEDGNGINHGDKHTGNPDNLSLPCLLKQLNREIEVFMWPISQRVSGILDRLEYFESLFPSTKAIRAKYGKYLDRKLQTRIKVLCVWSNLIQVLRQKLCALADVLYVNYIPGLEWPFTPHQKNAMEESNDTTSLPSARVEKNFDQFDSYSSFNFWNSSFYLGGDENHPAIESLKTKIYRIYVEKCVRRGSLAKMVFRVILQLHATFQRVKATLVKRHDFHDRSPPPSSQGGTGSISRAFYLNNLENNSSIWWDNDFFQQQQEPPEMFGSLEEFISMLDVMKYGKEPSNYYESLHRYGCHGDEFKAMHLPSFRTIFLFLLRIPLDLVYEWLRLRMEQKPDNPSLLSLQQLLLECKEVIKASILVRHYYLTFVKAVYEDETLPDLALDNYNRDLHLTFTSYLEFLEKFLLYTRTAPDNAQITTLEQEWDFIKLIHPYVSLNQMESYTILCGLLQKLYEDTWETIKVTLENAVPFFRHFLELKAIDTTTAALHKIDGQFENYGDSTSVVLKDGLTSFNTLIISDDDDNSYRSRSPMNTVDLSYCSSNDDVSPSSPNHNTSLIGYGEPRQLQCNETEFAPIIDLQGHGAERDTSVNNEKAETFFTTTAPDDLFIFSHEYKSRLNEYKEKMSRILAFIRRVRRETENVAIYQFHPQFTAQVLGALAKNEFVSLLPAAADSQNGTVSSAPAIDNDERSVRKRVRQQKHMKLFRISSTKDKNNNCIFDKSQCRVPGPQQNVMASSSPHHHRAISLKHQSYTSASRAAAVRVNLRQTKGRLVLNKAGIKDPSRQLKSLNYEITTPHDNNNNNNTHWYVPRPLLLQEERNDENLLSKIINTYNETDEAEDDDQFPAQSDYPILVEKSAVFVPKSISRRAHTLAKIFNNLLVKTTTTTDLDIACARPGHDDSDERPPPPPATAAIDSDLYEFYLYLKLPDDDDGVDINLPTNITYPGKHLYLDPFPSFQQQLVDGNSLLFHNIKQLAGVSRFPYLLLVSKNSSLLAKQRKLIDKMFDRSHLVMTLREPPQRSIWPALDTALRDLTRNVKTSLHVTLESTEALIRFYHRSSLHDSRRGESWGDNVNVNYRFRETFRDILTQTFDFGFNIYLDSFKTVGSVCPFVTVPIPVPPAVTKQPSLRLRSRATAPANNSFLDSQTAYLFMSYARCWINFVKDHYEKGHGKRPRWAIQGLNYLKFVANPCITSHLTSRGQSSSCQSFYEELYGAIQYVVGFKEGGKFVAPSHLKTTGVANPKHVWYSRSFESLEDDLDLNIGDFVLGKETDELGDSLPSNSVVTSTFDTILTRGDHKGEKSLKIDQIRSKAAQIDQKRNQCLMDLGIIGKACMNADPKEDNSPAESPNGNRLNQGYMTSSLDKFICKRVNFRWQRGIKVGQGQSAKVYTAVNMDSGELLAMKEIQLHPSNDQKVVKEVIDEMKIFENVNHPNLVRYYGVEVHREELLIFMEFCGGGTLEALARLAWAPVIQQMKYKDGNVSRPTKIKNPRYSKSCIGLSEFLIRKYTLELLLAVNHLHDLGIVHRDIKGANIYLSDYDQNQDRCKNMVFHSKQTIPSDSSNLPIKSTRTKTLNSTAARPPYLEIIRREAKNASILKLGDFGSAAKLKNFFTVPDEVKGLAGTPPFMAPEVINRCEGNGRPADIWSIGCVVIQMLTGKAPWSDSDNIFQIMYSVGSGQKPRIPPYATEEVVDFLNHCFEIDSKKRWTASQLLEHPFPKGGKL